MTLTGGGCSGRSDGRNVQGSPLSDPDSMRPTLLSSRRPVALRLLLVLVVGAMASCGEDAVDIPDPDPDPGDPVPATVTVVSGSGQVAVAGDLLPDPLVVVVRDAAGDPVPAVDVLWTVTGGGGSLNRTTVPTSAEGRATVTWTLGESFGPVHAVEAVVAGATTATFTAEGRPAAIEVVSGSGQTVAIGDTVPDELVVRVTGRSAQPAVGVDVTWTVTGGGGTVTATAAQTDANGLASAVWELGDMLGPGHTVEASAAPNVAEFSATGAIGAEWVPLASMLTAVRSPGAATDGDNVYIAGGWGTGGRVSDLQILDLTAGTWSSGGSIAVATDWPSLVWVNDELHLLGGRSASGFETQHWIYDDGLASWSSTTPTPIPIAGTAYGSDGTSIYLFAGNSNGYTSGTHIYDAVGDSWSTGMNVPGARINWSTILRQGRFYMFGGGTAGLGTSAQSLAYDPVGDTWFTLPELELAREAYGVGVLGDLVCVVGGRRASAGNLGTPFDDVSCYDPARNEWLIAPSLPEARQELVVVTTADGIVAMGGADSGGNPATDVWLLRLR